MKLISIIEDTPQKTSTYRTIRLSQDTIRVSSESIKGTLDDLLGGKISYSSAALDTLQLGNGQYMLVDGYHRFLEAYILGVKKLKIKNDNKWVSYYSIIDRTEAWDFDLSKLIDVEKLEILRHDLLKKSSMNKYLETNA